MQASPKFISTEPSGIDLSTGGSQKRIAETISEQIRNESFKLIGLDGQWGSGKSNVIKNIELQLKDTHYVFIYDTWSHQEDLQRRAFLEALTDELQQKHLIPQEEGKAKLEALLAKKKTTKQKVIPKLSNALIASILVTVFVPLFKLVGDGIPHLRIRYRLLIAASPVIIAGIIWLFKGFKNKKYFKLSELFYIYKERELEKEVSEVVSESEPSVREFRKWMFGLSDDLEQTKKKKKLIIVFDNMDRLPKEKVLSIWSLIHTFFNEENQYPNITTIVPFDRKQIGEFFGDKTNADSIGNHFIEKTFKVVFNIYPMALPDWKIFFKAKFHEGFGDTENDEYEPVENIYDLSNDNITPRKIIAFLNDLVALKLTWKELIKLRYMAVFALNKAQLLASPTQELLSETFLNKVNVVFKGDTEVLTNLSALAFNVLPEQASHVTLYRQIQVALRRDDANGLSTMLKHPHFFEILRQVISKEGINLDDAIEAVDKLKRDQPVLDDQQLRSVWKLIANKQMTYEQHEIKLKNPQKILIESSAGVVSTDLLVSYFIDRFLKVNKIDGAALYHTFRDLEALLTEKQLSTKALETMTGKELNADDFIAYAMEAKDKAADYKLYTRSTYLDHYLTETLPNNIPHLEVLKYTPQNFSFPLLTNKIEGMITNSHINSNNVEQVFSAYKRVSTHRPLQFSLPDARITELIRELEPNTPAYYEVLAMRLARTSEFVVNDNVTENPLTVLDDEKGIAEIGKRIEGYKIIGNLFVDFSQWPKPLLKHILLRHVNAPAKESIINTSQVINKFSLIAKNLEVSDEILLNALDTFSQNEEGKIIARNFIASVGNIELFNRLIRVETTLTKEIITAAIQYVEAVPKEIWQVSLFSDESYEWQILLALLRGGFMDKMPENSASLFLNAILIGATDAIPDIVSRPQEREMIYSLIDKAQLPGAAVKARDIFIDGSKLTPGKFIFFEPLLRQHGKLKEKADEVVSQLLLPLTQKEDALDIIITHGEYYSTLVSLAQVTKQSFINRIRDIVEDREKNKRLDEKLSYFDYLLDKTAFKDVKIIGARYYSSADEEINVDVTAEVKRLVEQDKRLHHKITNNLAGHDPHDYEVKKLRLVYLYDNAQYDKTWEEHTYWRLPE